MITPNERPIGWSEERLAALARAHDKQSEASAIEEDERPYAGNTMMEIPTELMPAVESLVNHHRALKA